MKKSGNIKIIIEVLSIFFLSCCFTCCKKSENPVKFPKGTFPDSVININDINSAFDDYNLALLQIQEIIPVIFSSNRKSSGGQFDLEQASIRVVFDQTTGVFEFSSHMTSDPFQDKLIAKAVTPGNDFGPYRLFSTVDGFEYLLLSSVNAEGNLDFYYLKNQPESGSILPDVTDPMTVRIINTGYDDAYICFNVAQDTAYFSTNKDGNFDLNFITKPVQRVEMDLSSWFNLDYATPQKVDILNSSYDEKCPYILKKIMVFASNRPEGYGGYDLYYSLLKDDKWSSPVNFGPKVNTLSDEYRPVIGFHRDFTNNYLMFSSNRPGGKGGFDLYFAGVDFSTK